MKESAKKTQCEKEYAETNTAIADKKQTAVAVTCYEKTV